MLTSLLGFALARRGFTVTVALLIAVAGVVAFRHLKLEAYPDISDPGVVVVTPYPGFAAEDVELQVTVPIERALNNTPFVIARRSRTIFGLSVVELTFADAVKNNNRNAGCALLDLGQQALAIRGSGLIRGSEDIEQIVLDAPKGVPVYMRDIGGVKVGAQPQTGIFALNQQASRTGGVEGIVLMRRWENPSDVLESVHAAVGELNSRLPSGVRMVPIYDRTDLVRNTLRTVSRVLVEGFIIVVTVLLLFLLDLRAALMTAIIIPLSLLFAFACMQLSGVSLSLLSIGAIDFGIIVDATIVMVERIMHRVGERSRHGEPRGAFAPIRAAVADVQRPIFFSLLIIIAAYIPLLTLERVERRRFTPMALTVCYALIGSLILSLTLIPALSTYLFARSTRPRRHRALEWATARYERPLPFTVP